MVVVHLPGVRDDGNRICLGQRGDFARLADAADAVGVELDVIHGASLYQFAKTVEGEFVFAAGNGNSPVGLQFCITVNVIRDHRLFQPAQMKGSSSGNMRLA